MGGGGYRQSTDNISSYPEVIEFTPNRRTIGLWSYFLQDEIELAPDLLSLTVGSKFQHNDFTDFEVQPTARILWTPTERHSLWASVSRAVRTPSRAEDDVRTRLLPTIVGPGVPVYPIVGGNRQFESEELLAWEAGIRVQPNERFSWDLATFFHQYDNLTGASPGMPGFGTTPFTFPFAPLTVGNLLQGQTYGFELTSTFQVNDDWRLSGGYSFLKMILSSKPGASPGSESGEGESPNNQVYVQSSWDIRDDIQFDVIGRYTDQLSAISIPSYVTMDLRLAWQPNREWEFSVVGRHLLDASHSEFAFDSFTGNASTQIQREVFGMVTWRH